MTWLGFIQLNVMAGNTGKKIYIYFTVQQGMFVSSEEQTWTWER
jgi:hypothetical protein